MPPEKRVQPLPFADEPIEVSEGEGTDDADDGEVIFIESLPDLLAQDPTWRPKLPRPAKVSYT